MERIIRLSEINHKKKLTRDAIGVEKEDLDDCLRQIYAEHKTFKDLLRSLGLIEAEVTQALKAEVSRMVKKPSTTNEPKISKAIVKLWTKKDREIITLREYVGTEILMWGMIKEFEIRHSITHGILEGDLGKPIPKNLQGYD